MHVMRWSAHNRVRIAPSLYHVALVKSAAFTSLHNFAPRFQLHSQSAVLERRPQQSVAPVESFEALGLGQDLLAALSEQRLSAPTEIQAHLAKQSPVANFS